MMEQLKKILYFPLATYFRFFAQIRLNRWKPRIIVVTGSNGKTTLLHLLESQIGESARFSHHANSAYGIPFDILGLQRKTMHSTEWISLFFLAPLQAFADLPKEKVYIVEADCDRPNEGKFLASFLRPEVVLWVSVSRTHGMNFDHLVIASNTKQSHGELSQGQFATVEEAIAYEYGYFLEYCQKLAVINGDLSMQTQQIDRTKADISLIKSAHYLDSYNVTKQHTTYTIEGQKYTFPALLPEAVFYSLVMCKKTVDYLGLTFDPTFKQFALPAGRSSLFHGVKQTTLVDSTYNANLASITAVLAMFAKLPGKKKWVVLGDMMELGEKEQEEHEQLAEVLTRMHLERIILVGKRMKQHTYKKLQESAKNPDMIESVLSAREALRAIEHNLQGGEEILFKGSQSLLLEGIIEPLLADQKDAQYLPRRGVFWEGQRRKKGL